MWIVRADAPALQEALTYLDAPGPIAVYAQEENARACAERMNAAPGSCGTWYAVRLVDLILEAAQEAQVAHGRFLEALRQLGSCLGGHAPQPAPPPPAVAPEKMN